MTASPIFNPHHDGSPFFWQGGPVGVLLVHGFTATVQEVRLLAKQLRPHGYTIGAPLLPGHYTRPADLNHVRWQEWIQAGEEMYQKLRLQCETVFLGGESAGGLVALYLASQHPEAAGILAYAPALRLNLRPRDLALLRILAPFVAYRPKGNLDASNNWQGYPVNPLKGVVQLLQLQKEVSNLLPGIHQPVLVVQGRQDTTVHASVPDTIIERIGSIQKECHWMPHSGHCVLLDQELDQVTQLTLNFMQHHTLSKG